MLRSILKIFIFITLFLVTTQAVLAKDKVPVFVSIVPQMYFVQQIGQELVDVQAMVQPGASPATYEPKPKQLMAISKTKIYFSIGVPFENAWLDKIASANPNMKVIPTDHGIQKIPMVAHYHPSKEEHGHNVDQHHDGIFDPHIWLSPPLVMLQARTVVSALQEVDPAHRSVYEANYKAFILQLVDLDAEFRDTLSGKHRRQFMVFHPAWGYFAHAYGLKQVPIEFEGKDPKPAQLKALIERAREHQINIVFVQPQFSSKSAKQVAKEIGGQVAFVDPLAENWPANLKEVADKFKAALR
jgi:zinc transport system substrate-binding protein